MGTLQLKILIAYKNVTKVQDTYRIQDLVDWINGNGGVNGREVTREQVKRGILTILERNKSNDRQYTYSR